jgi:hypothetical protein
MKLKRATTGNSRPKRGGRNAGSDVSELKASSKISAVAVLGLSFVGTDRTNLLLRLARTFYLSFPLWFKVFTRGLGGSAP